jgi:hypothetical protein
MNDRPCARGLLAWLALFLCGAAAAQEDVYVPEELEPWREWVLHGHESRACPFFFNQSPAEKGQAVCAWPGTLELAVGATEARFSQSWTVYGDEQWVPLPGDAARWPEGVTADGRPLTVVLRANVPAVRLAPGRHRIAGTIAWEQRPRALSLPAETGLVALTIDGRRIARPERSGNNLWLGERESAPEAADALQVEVYRLVEDGVPTRLYTLLMVDVAGRLREEVIEPALLPGFIPTALESDVPARLESDGRLRLQVRPGSFEVILEARAEDVLNEVTLPPPVRNLPDTEIWSYRSNDRLRVTVPEGLPPVDPEQVDVPYDFTDLPAFRVEAGDTLTIVERSRGKVGGGDLLHLARVLWLDFEGSGFTFSDTVTGQLDGNWRLDMAAPYVLQNAVENGENLLVTAGDGEGLTGVELRTRELNLEAYGRLDTRDAVPASGWQARLAGMSAELNLPPGQKLLAAGGADRARGAWLERWRLLDFFLVLIVTLAVAKLFGRPAGALALAALVLSWHEPGAPHWAWLNALAAIALARVAPAGRLRTVARAYRVLGVAIVVAWLVPFAPGELRIAIHPQLESQRDAAMAQLGRATKVAPAAEPMAVPAMGDEVEEIVVSAMRSRTYSRYAPNAIVQAGPGRPAWRWNTYALEWSGPVDPGRTLDLWILPRWLVSAWRIMAVLLSAAFAALLVLELVGRSWRELGPPRRQATPALGIALAAAVGLLAVPPAGAQTPSPQILEQLEQRLLEPPPCTPRCAEIVAARIDVSADAMSVELEVHAHADVAVPLPGSASGWRPERVAVDDASAPYVYRRADGTLWVRATPGRHRVELAGPLPPVESVDVPFPEPPRIVTAQAEGWEVAGIDQRRLRAGSLTLTRVRAGGEADARWESSRFPVFVRVERTIELDLDWKVTTTVTRVAPREGAITLDIPLLPGASLTDDLPVQDGRVRVAFGATEEEVEWSATLPRTTPLVLHAPAAAPWKEVWRFGVANIWHATFEGVPESEPEEPSPTARIAEFYPRGGESLTLHATRPEATAGATLAFDAVTLWTEVGARSRTVTLDLAYRSTRGAQHLLRLPADARLLDVSIDGDDEPLRLGEAGELTLPIVPGEHQARVRWQQDAAVGAWLETPAVDLGADAGNVSLTLDLSPDRWVLATFGPRLGPAVMYWPELAAMLLIALVLGRTSLTPLATRHWLLLGLGFSTFSWPVLALVATWLLAAGARVRLRLGDDVPRWRYNALQVAFALLSLSALFAILVSVPVGLLGSPDMHIAGNGSYGQHLSWFHDRSAGPLPGAAVFSLPLWVYKLAILAWALWLSFALLRWLPWAWRAFVAQGLWRGRPPRAPAPV